MDHWYNALYNMTLADIEKEHSLIKLASILHELELKNEFGEETQELIDETKRRIIEVIQNNEIFLL